jgi:hypothetical protein
MARHETFTLDNETATRAAAIRHTLTQANGEGIGIRFTVEGRDTHAITERQGVIVGWAGIAGLSNEAITVETDKGPRTFNVWLIRSVEIVGV